MKNIITTILIGLGLFSTLLLEARLHVGATLELVAIFVGIIFFGAILFGMWLDAPWTYPLASIMFSIGLANLIWLFALTQHFGLFALGLLANVAGIVICLNNSNVFMPLETYDLDIDQEIKQLRAETKALRKRARKK